MSLDIIFKIADAIADHHGLFNEAKEAYTAKQIHWAQLQFKVDKNNAAGQLAQFNIAQIEAMMDEPINNGLSYNDVYTSAERLMRNDDDYPFFEWIIREIIRDTTILNRTADISLILDWMRYQIENDPGFNFNRYKFGRAFTLQQRWHAEHREQGGQGYETNEIVKQWNNGLKMAMLRSENDHKTEGNVMNNCTHSIHWPYVRSGREAFFSLRNNKNKPITTILIEYSGEDDKPHIGDNESSLQITYDDFINQPSEWKVGEIKGQDNNPPAAKYTAYISQFLNQFWNFPDNYTQTGQSDYMSLHRHDPDFIRQYLDEEDIAISFAADINGDVIKQVYDNYGDNVNIATGLSRNYDTPSSIRYDILTKYQDKGIYNSIASHAVTRKEINTIINSKFPTAKTKLAKRLFSKNHTQYIKELLDTNDQRTFLAIIENKKFGTDPRILIDIWERSKYSDKVCLALASQHATPKAILIQIFKHSEKYDHAIASNHNIPKSVANKIFISYKDKVYTQKNRNILEILYANPSIPDSIIYDTMLEIKSLLHRKSKSRKFANTSSSSRAHEKAIELAQFVVNNPKLLPSHIAYLSNLIDDKSFITLKNIKNPAISNDIAEEWCREKINSLSGLTINNNLITQSHRLSSSIAARDEVSDKIAIDIIKMSEKLDGEYATDKIKNPSNWNDYTPDHYLESWHSPMWHLMGNYKLSTRVLNFIISKIQKKLKYFDGWNDVEGEDILEYLARLAHQENLSQAQAEWIYELDPKYTPRVFINYDATSEYGVTHYNMIEKLLNDQRFEPELDMITFEILHNIDPAPSIKLLEYIIDSPLVQNARKQKAKEAIRVGKYLEKYKEPHSRIYSN